MAVAKKSKKAKKLKLDDHTSDLLDKTLSRIEKDGEHTLYLGGFVHAVEGHDCDMTEHGDDIAELITEKTGKPHVFDKTSKLIVPG